MNQDWTIQHRGDRCAATGEPFREGAYFYTLLFYEKGEFRREDLSESAFKARNENIQPFSFWRSRYEPPAQPAPEPLGKQTAEDLLRRYMAERTPEHQNARYILAVMLERKKLLKEIEVRRGNDGALARIYEHTKSGEVFVVPDPQLRLDQIADMQSQVAALLG
jgi:hypothetical protein